MLPVIVAAVLSLATIGFLIWFWARTPSNLTKWYCVPVTLFGAASGRLERVLASGVQRLRKQRHK